MAYARRGGLKMCPVVPMPGKGAKILTEKPYTDARKDRIKFLGPDKPPSPIYTCPGLVLSCTTDSPGSGLSAARYVWALASYCCGH